MILIRLILTEKPSVAMQTAKMLGDFTKKDGYLESKDYLLSWCVGHLVQLSHADAYDEKYQKWELEHLPILLEKWKLNIIDGKEAQFYLLKKLMNDNRITSLICATDCGREGELIFRFVYEHAQCTKPFERLWISSLEDQAIKNGKEYDALYDSAIARAKADWLFGINATMLFSCIYKHPLHVGRVQSPTLAMIAERDNQIANFQKEKSYKVNLNFGEFEAQSIAYKSVEEAEELKRACEKSQAQVISVDEKETKSSAPPLFDLTSLQRAANRLYGYSAKDTLNVAQSLYEKKLLTYPRTDSKYITSDMHKSVEDLAKIASENKGINHDKPDIQKLIDVEKVQDHHALLPTENIAKMDINALSNIEKDILNLVVSQLIIATGNEHIFTTKTVNIICADTAFTAKGKVIVQNGYKTIEAQLFFKEEGSKDKLLPPLVTMQELYPKSIDISEHESSPPKAFTEDTLLASMSNAGKSELDKSLDHEKQGLGTPATRASVIEKLISTGSIERKNKQLVSTTKGQLLCSVLPNEIKSASLTASWENQLTLVADGKLSSRIYMEGIEKLVDSLMELKDKPILENPFQEAKKIIGICSKCKSHVYESKSNFYCDNRDCSFALWKKNRFFESKKKTLTKKIAVELLETGKAKIKGLHSEKTGKKYDALVLIDLSHEKYVNFKIAFENA